MLFHAWYRTFRSIDFSQAENQLHATEPDIRVAGLGFNCVLIFQDIDSSIKMSLQLLQKKGLVEAHREESPKYFFPTGGIASNCCPKGFFLQSECVDPILYDDGGGPVTFSKELKDALSSGGFPFWNNILKKKHVSLPIKYQPKYLDILPQLKNGLVDFDA